MQSRNIVALLFLFLFTYSSAIFPTLSKEVFLEKNVETEKETNKTEKESLEEDSGETICVGKHKKSKKSPGYSSSFLPTTTQTKCVAAPFLAVFIGQLTKCSFTITSSCPLYISYHQLVFYEV